MKRLIILSAFLFYLWYFGDGTISHEVNPIHIYTNYKSLFNVRPRSCVVFLMIRDNQGAVSVTQTTIVVYPEWWWRIKR